MMDWNPDTSLGLPSKIWFEWEDPNDPEKVIRRQGWSYTNEKAFWKVHSPRCGTAYPGCAPECPKDAFEKAVALGAADLFAQQKDGAVELTDDDGKEALLALKAEREHHEAQLAEVKNMYKERLWQLIRELGEWDGYSEEFDVDEWLVKLIRVAR